MGEWPLGKCVFFFFGNKSWTPGFLTYKNSLIALGGQNRGNKAGDLIYIGDLHEETNESMKSVENGKLRRWRLATNCKMPRPMFKFAYVNIGQFSCPPPTPSTLNSIVFDYSFGK